MKIIIYVDYSSSEFNKDFALSNALLTVHNVFLVSSEKQLEDYKDKADFILIGYSRGDCIYSFANLNCCNFESSNNIINYLENVKLS